MNKELEIIVDRVVYNIRKRYKDINLKYDVHEGYCTVGAILTLHIVSINDIMFSVNTSVEIPKEDERKHFKTNQLVGILTQSLVYAINTKWLKIIESDEVKY